MTALPDDAEAFAARHGLMQGFWVFGYGSLMWNPEVPHTDRVTATVHGYHRRFCVYSHVYRGSPKAPGLLLGLDRGGSCRGIGFEVPANAAPEAWAALWAREMVTRVYRPVMLKAATAQGALAMLAFVAEPRSDQYCPDLSPEAMADIIRAAAGTRGSNRDYFVNTLAHLETCGIRDRALRHLARLVGQADENS